MEETVNPTGAPGANRPSTAAAYPCSQTSRFVYPDAVTVCGFAGVVSPRRLTAKVGQPPTWV